MLIYRVLKKYPDQFKILEVERSTANCYYIKKQIGCPTRVTKDLEKGDRHHSYGLTLEEAKRRASVPGAWRELCFFKKRGCK